MKLERNIKKEMGDQNSFFMVCNAYKMNFH